MSEYEYTMPRTIGGAAGTFTLTSPWNTPCEYCIRAISASGAGGLCVSIDAMQTVAVSDTTVTNPTGGFQGELYNFHSATPAPLALSALFSACPTGTVVLTVTGASNILATVHFRRALGVAREPIQALHINPDVTPEEAVHAQRAAMYQANPITSEGA